MLWVPPKLVERTWANSSGETLFSFAFELMTPALLTSKSGHPSFPTTFSGETINLLRVRSVEGLQVVVRAQEFA